MLNLMLLRHAKSSWAETGQTDLDRPLNKRAEWAAYKAHVSQFELDRYLGTW